MQENDTTAGNTDVFKLSDGIRHDQVWLRKVGNNLELSIIGTSDKVTVNNWYLGNAYHVERIKTTDPSSRLTLLDTDVDKLVEAMAQFEPPAAGQTTLPANYQQALAPVLAANWH